MIKFCQEKDIKLLTYGTLLGGFFSEKYLDVAEPTKSQLTTWSLSKYKRFIDQWGGWKLFQELLQVLKQVADKHHVTIANVVTKFILDKPCVGGVITGARLGLSDHIKENVTVFGLKLDEVDVQQIEKISKKGTVLSGDCGDEYR